MMLMMMNESNMVSVFIHEVFIPKSLFYSHMYICSLDSVMCYNQPHHQWIFLWAVHEG